jgi:hypothetical protein
MSLTVKIKGDASHFDKTIGKTKSSIGTLGAAAGGVGIAFVAAGAAITAAAVAAGKFYLNMVDIGEKALADDARLLNITKQMGLFGDEAEVVTNRLIDFADAQERATGTNTIAGTQAKLMTFKELAATADEMGGSFDRATMAAVDMAAAGFGAAETNAVQLGKALNDPVKGITALARSGITFTAQEREKVKVLVESNQMLKAQDLILRAIEKQVGGTAAASATSTSKIKQSYALLKEEFAAPFAMSIMDLPNQLESMFPQLKQFAADAGLVFSTAFRDAFQGDLEGIVNIGELIGMALKAGIDAAFHGVGSTIMEKITGLGGMTEYLDKLDPSGQSVLSRINKSFGSSDVASSNFELAVFEISEAARELREQVVADADFKKEMKELFARGFRPGDPGSTPQMDQMLRQLERMNQTLDKPFPN